MLRRTIYMYCLLSLVLSFLLPIRGNADTPRNAYQPHALADFPTVDPNYIYDQLFYMVTHFQHREAGYDNNLPVNINGHDEFATYWSQEMARDLQGFGPQISIDKFPVQGWIGRPAPVPAFNVEVTVPGVVHPEQVVVIGCHYDGEAISTQSANDDGSGCAIELGVAKAMGEYWRSFKTYPARTLRFVIFDAEEQGLYGSFHYLNSTINGDVHNVVAMFNEEQNGIAYPLRYLGQMSNPLLPFYIPMSPLKNSSLYPHQDKLSQQQRDNITHFRSLMQQAIPAVFQQFQALGFQSLTYHDASQRDVSQPIFTSDQMTNIHTEDDALGGSDQIPFTLAGLPCATFVGNSTYYDRNPPPPPWSYPFDQRSDTIQLMNTFASGSSQKAPALVLALALPGMLTTWMLNQPNMLGQVSADGQVSRLPIAAISDIGQLQVGKSISLNAKASFDPISTTNDLTYAWNFGDGTTATGVSVSHTYTAVGTYTLSLVVASPHGVHRVLKILQVGTRTTTYGNPYTRYPADGNPPSNPAVILPTPHDSQSGQVPTTSTPTLPSTLTRTSNPLIALIIGAGVAALIGIVLLVGLLTRRKRE